MKLTKYLTVLSLLILPYYIFSQIDPYVYQLNETDSILTNEIKELLKSELKDKRVVFLGESEHHIGSDFKGKTEIVKFLVNELGYKDIAFESDFVALYFDHNKRNIFPFWSQSVQCESLFSFIENKGVTLWGFDNQSSSYDSYHNLANRLTTFLDDNKILYKKEFITDIDIIIKNYANAHKELKKEQITGLITSLDALINSEQIKKDNVWYQVLTSLKTYVLMSTKERQRNKAIPIRDSQMALNLNFLIHKYPDKKFIVWLANAHMSKCDYDFMEGQTMGYQFIQMNPGISYHIAFSSIKMPYRNSKYLAKSLTDQENMLHFLPDIDHNYFINAKTLIEDHPEFKEYEYEGMFHLNKDKTNWFNHFDALIFISKGEKVSYPKK